MIRRYFLLFGFYPEIAFYEYLPYTFDLYQGFANANQSNWINLHNKHNMNH